MRKDMNKLNIHDNNQSNKNNFNNNNNINNNFNDNNINYEDVEVNNLMVMDMNRAPQSIPQRLNNKKTKKNYMEPLNKFNINNPKNMIKMKINNNKYDNINNIKNTPYQTQQYINQNNNSYI